MFHEAIILSHGSKNRWWKELCTHDDELERLLASVPSDVLDREPGLLVLRAWLLGDFQSRHSEMSGVLDRAEEMLARGNGPRVFSSSP